MASASSSWPCGRLATFTLNLLAANKIRKDVKVAT